MSEERKITRYRLFEDQDETVWAAESEEQLREYDTEEYREYGEVYWPVRELPDAEIDRREIDCTDPDADEEAPDFKREIVSMREFLFENIYGGTGVQTVCCRDPY
jgi:hypothetical protein